MIKTIDGALFARMIVHGSACINLCKQEINDLNVFPVPDGDTGTNMSMTIGTAAEEMGKRSFVNIGDAANATANALLRGARGNSGVILSLLFRGFAKAVKEKETIDGRDFARWCAPKPPAQPPGPFPTPPPPCRSPGRRQRRQRQ